MKENYNLNNDKILRRNNFFVASNEKLKECKYNIKSCRSSNTNWKPYTK